jgi:hypothetical protein
MKLKFIACFDADKQFVRRQKIEQFAICSVSEVERKLENEIL